MIKFLNTELETIFNKYQVESNIIPDYIGVSENLKGLSYELDGKPEQQWMKAGRFLTKYTLIPEPFLSAMTRTVNEFLLSLREKIETVVSYDFEFAYNENNYFNSESGNLGCSCMRCYAPDCDDFYSSIPCCQIVTEIDSNDRVISRALIWDTDEGIYLDRTYSINDQYVIACEYDKEYGRNSINCLIKTNMFFQNGFTQYNDKFVPYLDTFCNLLCDNTGRIYLSANDHANGMFFVGCARSTSRYLEDYNEDLEWNGDCVSDNRKECYECGNHLNNDDYVYLNDEYYCSDCVRYSDYYGEYIPASDAIYTQHNGDYILNEDAVQLHDGDYAHIDDVVKYDGDYYLVTDMVETFDMRDIPRQQSCNIDGKVYHTCDDGIGFNRQTGQYELTLAQLTLKFA